MLSAPSTERTARFWVKKLKDTVEEFGVWVKVSVAYDVDVCHPFADYLADRLTAAVLELEGTDG